MTDTEAAVSTASDGFGAGVPSGVATATGAVASACDVAAATVGDAIAVGTGDALSNPAPESARGTMPSKRKRIAMIPMPQRA